MHNKDRAILAATMSVLVATGLLVSGEEFLLSRLAPPSWGMLQAPDMLAAPDKLGWSVDKRSGCWVWNPYPLPYEVISSSVVCNEDGRATGYGTFGWGFQGGDVIRRYRGEYQDGKQHGHGILTWPGGARYEGSWRDGKQNGRGEFTWANGNRYVGEYKDDNPDGRGVLMFANGDSYEGDFRDGRANGRGVLTQANGNRYEGGFRNDLPEGFGEYMLNGEKLSGNWARGCLSAGDRTIALRRSPSECR